MVQPLSRPGKPGGKRAENRIHRVVQLSDAALDLFLEQGIANVTIDAIVDRAGVAKGSFYRYFADKTALVAQLLAPLAAVFRAAMSRCADALRETPSPGELAREYLRLAAALSTVAIDHPGVVRLYLQESRQPAVGARRPLRELADELRDGAIELTTIARNHELLRDTDPRIGALTVVGAAEQLLFAYLNGVDLGDPSRIPSTLISNILDGVRQRPS